MDPLYAEEVLDDLLVMLKMDEFVFPRMQSQVFAEMIVDEMRNIISRESQVEIDQDDIDERDEW